MIERKVVIKNKQGIHARPSAKISQIAMSSDSDVVIIKSGVEASALSVISILSLGAVHGTKLLLRVDGEDEEEVMEKLVQLIEVDTFGE